MMTSQYEDYQNIPLYKIIIIGQGRSGKTKLLTRYKYGTYLDEGVSTIGVDSIKVKTKQAQYSYFDTCGQQKYRTIVSSFIKGSDACLLTYDISSTSSFDQLSYYYNQVKQLVPNCLIYLIGCKGDRQRQVSQQMIHKYYKGYRHEITSAKNNFNVQQTFKQLEKQLFITKKKIINHQHLSHKLIIEKKKIQKKNQGWCS